LKNCLATKEDEKKQLYVKLEQMQQQLVESEQLRNKSNADLIAALQTVEDQKKQLEEWKVAATKLEGMQKDLDKTNRTNEILRNQLLNAGVEATKEQNRLQGELQSSRSFVEELKMEFEEYSEMCRVEFDRYKRSKHLEYQRLSEEFEVFKTKTQELNQTSHRELQDVVHTLQAQFSSYRSTAEQLFLKEAVAFEEKLKEQQEKYEKEMRFVVKSKDMHYNSMVTTKDAKIMNLLEGTDLQNVLINHQLELEVIAKQHTRDMEMVRQIAENEARRQVMQLRRQIHTLQQDAEQSKHQILGWQKKLNSTLEILAKQKASFQLTEEANADHIKEVQSKLSAAHNSIEKLNQQKENLRHRILRLRLQIEGKADDTLDSIVRRLAKETDKLNVDISELSSKYKSKVEDSNELLASRNKAVKSVSLLEDQLQARTKEYDDLVITFERFLKGRLRAEGKAKVSSFPRASSKSSKSSRPTHRRLSGASSAQASPSPFEEEDPQIHIPRPPSAENRLDHLHAIAKSGSIPVPAVVRTAFDRLDNEISYEDIEEKRFRPTVEPSSNRMQRRKKTYFQVPAKLKAFVDCKEDNFAHLENMKLLEDGFKQLQNFKRNSSQFESAFKMRFNSTSRPHGGKNPNPNFGSQTERIYRRHYTEESLSEKSARVYGGHGIHDSRLGRDRAGPGLPVIRSPPCTPLSFSRNVLSLLANFSYRPIVILGPCGVGKKLLMKMAIAEFRDMCVKKVSHTTRPMRVDEVDGETYHFISREQMISDIASRTFIEYSERNNYFYGSSVKSVEQCMETGKVCLMELDVTGLDTMRTHTAFNPWVVQLIPTSLDGLRSNLQMRGFKGAELEAKVSLAHSDLNQMGKVKVDYSVVCAGDKTSYPKLREKLLEIYNHLDGKTFD